MAASTIASAASTLACSTGTVESRVLPRHGLSSLVPAKAFSPLKLVSNGSRVSMRQRLGFVASVRVLYVRNMARALGVNNGVQKTNANSGSRKELDVAGPTALALLAAAVLPEIAEAAAPGVSPSLKNLLLSVVAGGVVLVVIGGAVAAVSTFDPVKRK